MGLPEKNTEIVFVGPGNSGKSAFVEKLNAEGKYNVVSYRNVYDKMMEGFENEVTR